MTHTSSIIRVIDDHGEFAGLADDDHPQYLKKSENTIVVAASGGDFTTLSAALASITDAADDNEYTIIVIGEIAETAVITAKSHVHVFGLVGAHVDVNSTSAINGLEFAGITNSVWRGIKLSRSGAVTAGTWHASLKVSGATDDTVRFEHCRFVNNITGQAGWVGVRVGDTASPIFKDCYFKGGEGGNHCSGGYITDTAVPTFRDCHFKGGDSGWTCAGSLIANTASPSFYGCIFEGGGGGQYCYGLFLIDDCTPLFEDCQAIGGGGDNNCWGVYCAAQSRPIMRWSAGYGGAGGTGCNGLYATDAAGPTLTGCAFHGGDGGAGCHGIVADESAAPFFLNCSIAGGQGGTDCYGAYVWDSAAPVLDNCAIYLEIYGFQWYYDDADNGRFRPFSGDPYQLAAIQVRVWTANPGVTLDIGTTVGGNDIANDIDIGSTGFKQFTLQAGADDLRAAGAYMYATPSAGIADADVQICYTTAKSYNNCYGVYISSWGCVRLNNCMIEANVDSDAIYVTDAALNADQMRASNCHIEARQGNSKKAVVCQSAYNPAPFYNSVLVGGSTNLTCAAGTPNGTCVEV